MGSLPLATPVNVTASLAASAVRRPGDPWKPPEDLDRYAAILAATLPEIVVETGTHGGHMAAWLARGGVDVVTVDVVDRRPASVAHPRVTFIQGSSTDPGVVVAVTALAAGRRCMVSLDSDHSAAHVEAEIRAYGPLVSIGCYLVVEDTIWGWSERAARRALPGSAGTPLDAVAAMLAEDPAWERDLAVESMAPVSNAPAGWWVRRA
jgi:cephalosporin hydroxylase